MIDFGTALRQARQTAGLSLEDIFERTRISLRHLRAIEAGDFPSVPQTYIRAFIREYARVVGLDEDDTLARYNEMAEAQAGIPRPPDAFDNTNILPHPDDTIEIIGAHDASATHVEVLGSAEVDDSEPFVPPVRKSTFVPKETAPDDSATASGESRRPVPPDTEARRSIPPIPSAAPPSHASTLKSAAASAPEKTSASDTSAASTTAGASGTISTSSQTHSSDTSAASTQPGATNLTSTSPNTGTQNAASAPAKGGDRTAARSAARSAAPVRQDAGGRSDGTAKKAEGQSASPFARAREFANTTSTEQRRIMWIGSVIALIVIVALFAAYYFSTVETAPESMVDSTSIRASIDAGKFIDSSQNTLPEPELPIKDSSLTEQPAEEQAMEPAPRVFAREDSLVLEAFSSAPVWFSVRMDTTRTERGQLTTNDHRVWKARDRFLITLGDAGAVTFFLNGREIGTLGDEGSVIKNVALSRQNLHGEQ